MRLLSLLFAVSLAVGAHAQKRSGREQHLGAPILRAELRAIVHLAELAGFLFHALVVQEDRAVGKMN